MQRFCSSRSLVSAASRITRPQPRFSPARVPKSHHSGFRCARALSSHPQSVAGASTSTSTSTPNPSPRESEEHAELSEHDLRFGLYDVILPEEPFMWGTAHILPRPAPAWIARPPYVDDPAGAANASTERRLITDAADVVRLRRAADLARRALELAGSLVAVGRTTLEIDTAVHEFVVAHGAYPSPLRYKGFPRACCTSVNNVVVHGIPDERPLQDGDIVNVDVTAYLDGFHGDTSRTFLVGDVDENGRELVRVTEAALEAGIAACAPGQPFRSIARAIHDVLKGRDYVVCPMFTGHGIGREFHRRPWVYHTLNDEPEVMQPGDCFTIEPAIIQGDDPASVTYPDGWTVATENCARAAQAEDMVLITNIGVEVLTRK